MCTKTYLEEQHIYIYTYRYTHLHIYWHNIYIYNASMCIRSHTWWSIGISIKTHFRGGRRDSFVSVTDRGLGGGLFSGFFLRWYLGQFCAVVDIWMSKRTCGWVMATIGRNHGTHINGSCHTYDLGQVFVVIPQREVGGWGRVPFSRNLMSPTPRRKWYLTTGRRFH